MHFTGTIWRPPYESGSLLIEAAAGCTHHRCKFCTLYDDLPFSFRMSPLEDIEADLQEAQLYQTGPLERLGLRLQGLGGAAGSPPDVPDRGKSLHFENRAAGADRGVDPNLFSTV